MGSSKSDIGHKIDNAAAKVGEAAENAGSHPQ